MKDAVLIKSFQNGITLMLNEEASFEQILKELAFKFSEARNFFGKSSIALSIEGKELNNVEEIQVIETIKQNSNINIMCISYHKVMI